MSAIASEERDGVLLLTIDRPPVNALDVETLDELSDGLDDAAAADPDAVILTGTGSIFSAGADLWRVLEADASYIDAGIVALGRCFKSLFNFQRPTVAAVTAMRSPADASSRARAITD
jgi:enoyl-CoA hydratase